MNATIDLTTGAGGGSGQLEDIVDPDTYSELVTLLANIKASRAEKPDQWNAVGRIIFRISEGSQAGLALWDKWSRDSSKHHIPAKCARAWADAEVQSAMEEMTVAGAIKELRSMAEKDNKTTKVKPASSKARPQEYVDAYHAMGYTFTTNEMNDRVYVNGTLMTDGIAALIMTKLGNHGFKSFPTFQRAFIAEGEEHRFHPIKDYLNGLVWDGQDHIDQLASHFQDEDNVFGLYLKKWLLGAVEQILDPSTMSQNPMLVLAGAQGLGKSVFAAWLGSGLPGYFVSKAIHPDSKDDEILAVSKFVWEVEELGSTIRRSDQEALKAFLSKPERTFRVPYGRHDVLKPTTVSFIGTSNLDGNGFINDPTGHRRFRVVHLTNVDWKYRRLSVDQLWAQAVNLYRVKKESYRLEHADEMKAREINDRYVVSDPLEDYVSDFFDVDPAQTDWFVSTTEILEVLKDNSKVINQLDRQLQMRIAATLTRMGLKNRRKTIGGRKVSGWAGMKMKP